MEKFKFWALLTALTGLSIVFTSCGENDDEVLYTTPNESTTSSDLSDSQVKKLIAENVNVKASYKDYVWRFEITSTLHKALPDKSIKYGIGHGDVDGNTSVSVEKQAFSFSKRTSNGNEIINFENPFWYYYAFGTSTPDQKVLTLCELYYKSYIALIEKGVENLESSEYDLYNDITNYLDEKEYSASLFYRPSIQISIDGGTKYYKVAEYR